MITPAMLREWNACWTDERIAAYYAGRSALTHREIAEDGSILRGDRSWVLMHYANCLCLALQRDSITALRRFAIDEMRPLTRGFRRYSECLDELTQALELPDQQRVSVAHSVASDMRLRYNVQNVITFKIARTAEVIASDITAALQVRTLMFFDETLPIDAIDRLLAAGAATQSLLKVTCMKEDEQDFVGICTVVSRPLTQEAVKRLISEFYTLDGNSCGGSLHIVLDDQNWERHHVEWCLEQAHKRFDVPGVVMATLLLELTDTQLREWVGYLKPDEHSGCCPKSPDWFARDGRTECDC